MKEPSNEHFLISRTDGIGDVILTLPLAAALKHSFPGATVSFLGRSYTKPLLDQCEYIDSVMSWDALESQEEKTQLKRIREWGVSTVFHVFPRAEVVDLMYKAKVPTRIATARRWHTFLRVNKQLWYSRRKSNLHEAQLNLKMLGALGIESEMAFEKIGINYGLTAPELDLPHPEFFSRPFRVLLHPMSHGSALEWPLEKFSELATKLSSEGIAVGITGTAKERERMEDHFEWGSVADFGGKLSLVELMTAIDRSHGLVAASTGPLHIAAALGRYALGLYSPKRPLHPGRWAPIGPNASFLVSSFHPEDGKLPIEVDHVVGRIREWKARR